MNGLFRWAGGKGRIADALFARIDTRLSLRQVEPYADRAPRWIEPFVGGGAMALEALRRGLAHKYILADASADVISVYEALHDRFVELVPLRRVGVDGHRDLEGLAAHGFGKSIRLILKRSV